MLSLKDALTGIALATAAIAAPVQAQQVLLKSDDGSMAISGDLAEFDGQTYKVTTILGVIEIDALQVTCEGPGCPVVEQESATMAVAGDKDILEELMPLFTDRFAESLGGSSVMNASSDGISDVIIENDAGKSLLDIGIQAQTANAGFESMSQGSSQIVFSRRAVGDDEYARLQSSGRGDMRSDEQEKVIGLDGVVVVTSKRNRLRVIGEEALARIFAGEVTDWSQLGLPQAPIKIYLQDPEGATASLFKDVVLTPRGKRFLSNVQIVSGDRAVDEAVAQDPTGIGLSTFSKTNAAKIVDIRGVCGLQVSPTRYTIKTEEYPLTQRIFAYKDAKADSPIVSRFFEFLDSDTAQDEMDLSSLVGLGVSYQNNNEQGLRYLSAIFPSDVEVSFNQLRGMSERMLAADRMSITFRFDFASSNLDARAREDIDRLVQVLITGDFENKEILLVGFTDAIGEAYKNQSLSERRANFVRNALIEAAPAGSLDQIKVEALGFGEISPVACNQSDNGRAINRRVEVWVRDIVSAAK